MLQLVYGQDALIVPWICRYLGMHIPHPCVAIGIAKNNNLIGAALYHNFTLTDENKPLFIEMSFGVIDKKWASRHIVNALLGYPFFQLRVKRVQSTVSKRNKTVRLFLDHLGFKLEGTGRQAWPHGGDACMYSLLNGEFFSSKWNIRGQERTGGTSSTRSSGNICGPNPKQSANGALQFRSEQSEHHNPTWKSIIYH